MRERTKILVLIIALLLSSVLAQAQADSGRIRHNYEHAYSLLEKMLQTGNKDFATTVYYVENAWYGDSLSYDWYSQQIKALSSLAMAYVRNNRFLYLYKDSSTVSKYAGVFKVMTDSIPIIYRDTIYNHKPYTYNFSDFDGSASWPDMFVSTLLITHKGNCHSMPFLYRMVAGELGAETYLALAPNHTYIKLHSEKDGWYNTELTSADFPLDAWVMASGYVHLDAIRNGMYMDTLGNTKCMAMCMIDLAQGYEHKLGGTSAATDSFILKCCATALRYFPDYINALLLKAKTVERQFSRQMVASGATSSQAFIASSLEAQSWFNEMSALSQRIHQLGYRRMPAKMYLEWLAVLKSQQDKYSNKKITTFTK